MALGFQGAALASTLGLLRYTEYKLRLNLARCLALSIESNKALSLYLCRRHFCCYLASLYRLIFLLFLIIDIMPYVNIPALICPEYIMIYDRYAIPNY